MNNRNYAYLALAIFFCTSSAASDNLITCEFDKNFAIGVSDPKVSSLDGAYKTKHLQIYELETTPNNWKIDGSMRATNSRKWVELQKTHKSSLILAGDDGDLLTIDLDGALPDGMCRSTHASTYNGYAFTYIGKCQLRPKQE